MMKIFISFISILLIPTFAIAWNPFKKDCFDGVEDAAKELKRCEVQQILPNECESDKKYLEIAYLECQKQGFDIERDKKVRSRVEAAKELGFSKIDGDPKDSIYRKVRSSLYYREYFIVEEEQNYLLFHPQKCKQISDALFYHLMGRATVLLDNKKTVVYIFLPEAEHCHSPEEIHESAPFLTERQFSSFQEGKYFHTQSSPDPTNPFTYLAPEVTDRYVVKNSKTILVSSYDEGKRIFDSLKSNSKNDEKLREVTKDDLDLLTQKIYRNPEKHFSIYFPPSWSLENPRNPHVVAKSRSEDKLASIMILHNSGAGDKPITRTMKPKDLIQKFVDGLKEVEILDSGETTFWNEEALYVKSLTTINHLGNTAKMLMWQIAFNHNGEMYSIGYGVAGDTNENVNYNYSYHEPLFKKSLASFALDDWNRK